MDLFEHVQILQPAQGALRLLLGQDEVELVADALTGDPRKHGQGCVDQLCRPRFDGKTEPLLKARCAHDAGGVLDKAQAVQHADQAILQVLLAPVEIEQPAIVPRVEPDGQCIDRKVAPVQIGPDRAALDLGQRGRMGVELEAGRGEIEGGNAILLLVLLDDDLGRAKAPVAAGAGADPLSHFAG